MTSISRIFASVTSTRLLNLAHITPLGVASFVCCRRFATEHDLGVGAMPRPGEAVAKDPYAAKDAGFDAELEDKMKNYSGTAEDVHVKDKEKGSLNKMMADSTAVEKEYKEKAYEAAESAYNRSPREN